MEKVPWYGPLGFLATCTFEHESDAAASGEHNQEQLEAILVYGI
jgi:hypothetical protein